MRRRCTGKRRFVEPSDEKRVRSTREDSLLRCPDKADVQDTGEVGEHKRELSAYTSLRDEKANKKRMSVFDSTDGWNAGITLGFCSKVNISWEETKSVALVSLLKALCPFRS